MAITVPFPLNCNMDLQASSAIPLQPVSSAPNHIAALIGRSWPSWQVICASINLPTCLSHLGSGSLHFIIAISSPYHPLNLHIEKFPCLAEKSSSTPFLIGFMWGGGNMWQPCVQIRLHLQHSSHDQHPKRSPKSQASATVVSSFICSCDSCCCRCVITQSAC